ncbi:MAG: hypothetical protein ACXAEN_27405, partial [Candidatus Thorarchaeota archaeon]
VTKEGRQKMCIIVSKESGQKMPTKKTLKECFDNNKDGAGIMWFDDGSVQIDKGYMTFRSFWKALQAKKFTVKDQVVLHFRISTAGKIRPENTHPFPLHKDLDDLMKLSITCKHGVVHNGIIGQGEGKISDTMVFVRDVLADPMIKNNLQRPSVDNLICMSTEGSKLVIMDDKGSLRYYGAGWIVQDGIYYSNNTFKPWKPKWKNNKSTSKYGVYVNGKKIDSDYDKPLKQEKWEWDDTEWAICPSCGGDLQEIDEYGEYYECEKCLSIYDEDYRVVYQDDDKYRAYQDEKV